MLAKSKPAGPHRHDHFELFWLYHGHALHIVNKERQTLTEGTIVFVRPGDAHSLQGKGEETHFVNLALPSETIEALLPRYPELLGRFFWHLDSTPATYSVDSLRLADLTKSARHLEKGPRSELALEAFLLTLFTTLLDDPSFASPDGTPNWLVAACEAAKTPEVFRQGAAGLVQAAGKSSEHVSRVMQRHLQQSPTDYVNAIRMAYAADRLIGTSDSLPEIAKACGIGNMSHFHRLFQAAHGVTPRTFRVTYQYDVIRPKI
jgi:AraC family cel operon transcriptional repressor